MTRDEPSSADETDAAAPADTDPSTDDTDTFFRTLLKSGTILFIGLAAEMGISFVAKLVIANALETSAYGAIALGVTVMGITSTLVVLGLANGVGRYLPRYDDPGARRGLLVSAYQLVVPTALAAGAVVAVFAPEIARIGFSDPSVTPIIRIFGLAIPLAAFINLTIGSARGLKSTAPKVVIRNLILPLSRLAAVVVVLYLGQEAIGVAWAYLLSYAIAGSLAIYYVVRHTPLLSLDTPAIGKYRELLSFSLPLLVSAMMVHVFGQLDTLMMGYFVSTSDVGVYNVVYPLGELLTLSLATFRFVYMPIVSELDAESNYEEMKRVFQVITKWIAMMSLPVFLVIGLFPRIIINMTFGAKYNAGAIALSILAVGFFIHTVAGLNSETLTAMGRTRTIMWDNVAVAVLNVVLNLLLIPRYSFLGAAIATTSSYIALNLLYSYQLYSATGIQPFSRALVFPATVALGLVGLIYAVGTTLFDPGVPLLVAFGFVFAVTYGIVILRFGGVEEEEVMLVLSFEERYGVDLGPMKTVANRLMR